MTDRDRAAHATTAVEFDQYVEHYEEQHRKNVSIFGESPDYFSHYKVADLRAHIDATGLAVGHILDFGCGIGNAIPHFRRELGWTVLTSADVSGLSLEVAASRFPEAGPFLKIIDHIPLPDACQDVAFSASVFHHIPEAEQERWMAELWRVTRPGGLLFIYEHNPFNPLTVRAVNTCPFDANAKLLRPGQLKRLAVSAGWQDARISFKTFFPAPLRALRGLETHLSRIPLGAQYRLAARKG